MRKALLFIVSILVLSNMAFAQGVVKGVIKDGEGQPVIGATVVIKGTSTHAVSDINGAFAITAAKELPFTILIS